jgi:hypothetical protein
MKVHLMYRDQDFDIAAPSPPLEAALIQDLDLTALFDAMAGGDEWLGPIVKKAVLTSLTDVPAIRYRQEILQDCLRNAAVVRHIYDLTVETIERERKDFFFTSTHSPTLTLHRSVRVLQTLLEMLWRLRRIADEDSAGFASVGFVTLFTMLRQELDDDYLALLRHHLKLLQFREGILISARLGEGNKSVGHILRTPPEPHGNWLTRLFSSSPPGFTYQLADRDESGATALSELRDRGVNLVANALGQATDHVLSFFRMLRTELAFYVGCLNVQTRLAQKGCQRRRKNVPDGGVKVYQSG